MEFATFNAFIAVAAPPGMPGIAVAATSTISPAPSKAAPTILPAVTFATKLVTPIATFAASHAVSINLPSGSMKVTGLLLQKAYGLML